LGDVHGLHRTPDSRLKTAAKAGGVSAGLSILFLIVYGGCNWITARRSDIGTFYFEWERGIPFVPWMVLPYLSIDLFFVAAPFLLRSERELKLFAARVASAILVAGVFFLVIPLRFAFARPHAAGWIGRLFDWFLAFDAPFNLFPSLHAALWLLLLEVYARHLRGIVRLLVLVWFAFIGLSPLLTHQHHVIDIIGGLFLALCCRVFLSPRAQAQPTTAAHL
jgi:membrane-associated phospholipid phosphatase